MTRGMYMHQRDVDFGSVLASFIEMLGLSSFLQLYSSSTLHYIDWEECKEFEILLFGLYFEMINWLADKMHKM